VYRLKSAEAAAMLSQPDSATALEMWTVAGGMGSFWTKVADSLPCIRLNCMPVAVNRSDSRVFVETNTGEKMEFDFIFIASPLKQETLQYLDSSESEQALFQRIRYFDYYTTITRCQNLPKSGMYLLRDNCDPEHVGYPVAFHSRYASSDVILFYSYGSPEMNGKTIIQRIREQVAALGGKLTEICDQRRFDYFPHVAPTDVKNRGFMNDLKCYRDRETHSMSEAYLDSS
jgi:protoporphyrinogen oxidase